MIGNANGTFVINFKSNIFGHTEEPSEEGNWWTKDTIFYEQHNDSKATDTYKFTFLDENRVQFVQLTSGIDGVKPN